MTVTLLHGIVFYYLNKFVAVFKQVLEDIYFRTLFDDIYIKLSVKVDITKKHLLCILDFLDLKFNILKIKTCLLLNNSKKLLKV